MYGLPDPYYGWHWLTGIPPFINGLDSKYVKMRVVTHRLPLLKIYEIYRFCIVLYVKR